MAQYRQPLWLRLGGMFLASLFLPLGLSLMFSLGLSLGWAKPAPAETPADLCAAITQPLTPDERAYAQSAWNYFQDNLQASTGLSNAAGGYPSSTLWDLGNYLTALNSARWLGLIDQSEFDGRLNQFLTTLSRLSQFEDTLPNKVYNSATAEMTNYGNAPTDRGIGWSALDLGRMLAAFDVIRTCHPQYGDWLSGIVSGWNVAASIQDGQLYGATVLPDGSTLKVQEGRLGYEEYAARGYYAWGFEVPQALAYEPFKFVDLYGLAIPVDQRDYQTTNASNYVVSESYILDAIEFGLPGELAEFGRRVFEAQKRRYEDTGLLTAVSEDNLNGPPHFLYSTLYANGVPWAVITDTNELYPELRTLSTKAAFGWHYLYPEDAYGQQIFDAVKDRTNSGRGYYAGIFEQGLSAPEPPVNDILTGNTNGLILEILYYKARGALPILSNGRFATPLAPGEALEPAVPTPGIPPAGKPVTVPPIAPVGPPQPATCPRPDLPLSAADAQSARLAWRYFEDHTTAATGLVPDRSDLPGATLWGVGDYLAALQSAQGLGLIDRPAFDGRVRQLLGALRQMPLFAGELPHRAYSTLSLEPITYGGNARAEGNGWSGLDIGRLLVALHQLKTCHPEYTDAVDRTVLDWSFLRVIRNGQVAKAEFTQGQGGRDRIQITPATQLGYEEYAARAFQLWGFDAHQSAPASRYTTLDLEGQAVPVQRVGLELAQSQTTSTPFVLYGLEFGLEPAMRSLLQPMFQAEANRYQRSGQLSASGTALIAQAPYVVHSPLQANGQPWPAVADDGSAAPQGRIVSTAVALAYEALFPEAAYAQTLANAVRDRADPSQGYYEGLYEADSRPAQGFSSGTNSLILQTILHRTTGSAALIQPHHTQTSPWWQAIASGDFQDQGLPTVASAQLERVSDAAGNYWSSRQPRGSQAASVSSPPPAASLPLDAPPARPEAATPAMPEVPLMQTLSPQDQTAARWAWAYFENNWNPRTGLVNAMDGTAWSTLWDQGSAMLGIHAGYQLGLVPEDQFRSRLDRLLATLETLPLPATGLPNKAYSTATAEMRTLNNRPDRQGRSGWSALDMARYLLGLHTLKVHYPDYADRIDAVVARYDLPKLVNEGWLWGSGTGDGGLQYWQEGRLGYEQYAAYSLRLWGIEASNALHHAPVQTVTVEGVTLQIDQRDRASSGASNPLTNDPYLLWGLELGWPDHELSQVSNLLQAQVNRHEKTGILTAVNEDALDRQPYFLYYSVYADGQPWAAVNNRGQNYGRLRFLSTKAAFAWAALFPAQPYPQQLRQAVQTLADQRRGYLSGRYEDANLGPNRALNVNTNGIVLESLLYLAQGQQPIAMPSGYSR